MSEKKRAVQRANHYYLGIKDAVSAFERLNPLAAQEQAGPDQVLNLEPLIGSKPSGPIKFGFAGSLIPSEISEHTLDFVTGILGFKRTSLKRPRKKWKPGQDPVVSSLIWGPPIRVGHGRKEENFDRQTFLAFDLDELLDPKQLHESLRENGITHVICPSKSFKGWHCYVLLTEPWEFRKQFAYLEDPRLELWAVKAIRHHLIEFFSHLAGFEPEITAKVLAGEEKASAAGRFDDAADQHGQLLNNLNYKSEHSKAEREDRARLFEERLLYHDGPNAFDLQKFLAFSTFDPVAALAAEDARKAAHRSNRSNRRTQAGKAKAKEIRQRPERSEAKQPRAERPLGRAPGDYSDAELIEIAQAIESPEVQALVEFSRCYQRGKTVFSDREFRVFRLDDSACPKHEEHGDHNDAVLYFVESETFVCKRSSCNGRKGPKTSSEEIRANLGPEYAARLEQLKARTTKDPFLKAGLAEPLELPKTGGILDRIRAQLPTDLFAKGVRGLANSLARNDFPTKVYRAVLERLHGAQALGTKIDTISVGERREAAEADPNEWRSAPGLRAAQGVFGWSGLTEVGAALAADLREELAAVSTVPFEFKGTFHNGEATIYVRPRRQTTDVRDLLFAYAPRQRLSGDQTQWLAQQALGATEKSVKGLKNLHACGVCEQVAEGIDVGDGPGRGVSRCRMVCKHRYCPGCRSRQVRSEISLAAARPEFQPGELLSLLYFDAGTDRDTLRGVASEVRRVHKKLKCRTFSMVTAEGRFRVLLVISGYCRERGERRQPGKIQNYSTTPFDLLDLKRLNVTPAEALDAIAAARLSELSYVTDKITARDWDEISRLAQATYQLKTVSPSHRFAWPVGDEVAAECSRFAQEQSDDEEIPWTPSEWGPSTHYEARHVESQVSLGSRYGSPFTVGEIAERLTANWARVRTGLGLARVAAHSDHGPAVIKWDAG